MVLLCIVGYQKPIKKKKPNLVLIHGIGANAMWQWDKFITPLSSRFNLYVPDLLFFGESYTTRPEITELFQCQCVMRTMEAYGVKKMIVVGLSYGGFVGYSMAVQFPEAVEKLVLGCSGVCLGEKDMENGMFQVKSVDEAVSILLPQSPEKLRQLMSWEAHANISPLPEHEVMCTVNLQERKELIETLYNNRKFADLPKITQPTLIIWGEYDQIFPLELAHRLNRHLGENAQLVIIKAAGHAINMEKPKELYKHLKLFLLDSRPHTKPDSNDDSHKLD
ncbi:hypothetical protein RND71_025222 [Anisodus tanguticus]|uniref:AB hydrolase-1 domain-containing protein n=1 Tax=Anisodus tanguticus TaxID=243964 RepID=A0AAE1RR31_9SOLA|nr:hypothetical protein RND71_025222 [Anisodus tanguticus]